MTQRGLSLLCHFCAIIAPLLGQEYFVTANEVESSW